MRHDDAGRRTSATYAHGTGDAKTWSFQYWAGGQLKKVTKPDAVAVDFAYDNLERPASKTYSSGGADTYTYHFNGLLKTAASGLYSNTVDRSNAADYDGAGRLLAERQSIGAGSKTVSASWFADGQINTLTYPGGTAVAHAYINTAGTTRGRLHPVDDPPPRV